MHSPSTAVPNIPPIGLRDVSCQCVVCYRDLPVEEDRHPLRLQMKHAARKLPLLVIAYACKPCRRDRFDEVTMAHVEAAGRYIHRRAD
jgi:hypothetical protein